MQPPLSAGSRPSPGRVLVLARHPLLQRALSALVTLDAGLALCGEAADALDGLAAVRRLQPDLVITELPFDVFRGLALLRQIVAGQPGLPVLVVCWHDQARWADAAHQAGARACVARHEIGTRLPGLIRQVLGAAC